MAITANITYYNEPHMLEWWYRTFTLLNKEGFDLRLNIADDGSQRQPAIDFFKKHPQQPFIRLFRVKEDIGFNSHGCRNLLMKQTETDWNILSDIDRHYTDDTLIDILESEDKDPNVHYSFFALKTRTSTLNEYVIHKDAFWKSGGYDEEFVNIHWGDRIFFDTSLFPVCPRVIRKRWECEYVRGARNLLSGDNATTQYPDDHTLITPKYPPGHPWASNKNRQEMINFIRTRNADPEQRLNKPVINFKWERLL
jgi:hypothetical protein